MIEGKTKKKIDSNYSERWKDCIWQRNRPAARRRRPRIEDDNNVHHEANCDNKHENSNWNCAMVKKNSNSYSDDATASTIPCSEFHSSTESLSNTNTTGTGCEAFVLLIHPEGNIFEVALFSYDSKEMTVGGLLNSIPSISTIPILQSQSYAGFYNLRDATELLDQDLDRLANDAFSSSTDCNHQLIRNNLVAIPQGYTGQDLAKLSVSILENSKIHEILQNVTTIKSPELDSDAVVNESALSWSRSFDSSFALSRSNNVVMSRRKRRLLKARKTKSTRITVVCVSAGAVAKYLLNPSRLEYNLTRDANKPLGVAGGIVFLCVMNILFHLQFPVSGKNPGNDFQAETLQAYTEKNVKKLYASIYNYLSGKYNSVTCRQKKRIKNRNKTSEESDNSSRREEQQCHSDDLYLSVRDHFCEGDVLEENISSWTKSFDSSIASKHVFSSRKQRCLRHSKVIKIRCAVFLVLLGSAVQFLLSQSDNVDYSTKDICEQVNVVVEKLNNTYAFINVVNAKY